MKKVITYGTFDLLHVGHINLLRRAKALGDYLIVVFPQMNLTPARAKKRIILLKTAKKFLKQSVMWMKCCRNIHGNRRLMM